jgi:hypothetical protein
MEDGMRATASCAGGSCGLAAVGLGLSLALASPASAQKGAAAETPARFTMSPADGGGFIRLDTLTGQMSLCTGKDQQWRCTDMADQGRGLAEEIERLRSENKNLKAEIRRIEDSMLGDGKNAQQRPGESHPEADRRADESARKYGLPSEQDVDQAINYIERMFRKFRDKMKEFESENKATPL